MPYYLYLILRCLPMALAILYMFLVFWIIPCYPSYRSCFKASAIHKLSALLCALCLASLILIFFYRRRWEFMKLLPLLAVIAYVDQRDQEIPDFPNFLILLLHLNEINGIYYLLASLIFLPLYIFFHAGYIGFGDIKLITLWVILKGPNALVGLILGCLLCIIIAKIKKEPKDQKIPFGPYICAGMFFTLLFPF